MGLTLPYAASQDLIDRFGEQELVQLTDRANVPPEQIDDTVVERALADATATVDSYVGKVYALPIGSAPPVLIKVCCDIARYYLHGEAADKDSIVTRNQAAALAWLRDVAKGLVQLDIEGIVPGQPGGGTVRTSEPERPLTAATMKGYI